MRILILGIVLGGLTASAGRAQFIGSENFSAALGGSWSGPTYTNLGSNGTTTRSLAQSGNAGGSLEWTATTTSGSGANGANALLTWAANTGSYTANWTATLDTTNSRSPVTTSESVDIGLLLWNTADASDSVKLVLRRANFGSEFNRFHSLFSDNGSPVNLGDSADGVGNTGSLRFAFDSATKVLTTLYNIGGGWLEIGSFGLAGSGGTTANADWSMTSGSTFSIGVLSIAEIYDTASPLVVNAGTVYADNFMLSTTAIPEPSTYAALAGFAALGLSAWRRRQIARF